MAAEGPFSSPHILYTFHGTLPGGEQWSCGLRTEAATPTSAQLATAAQNAATAFTTMWNAGPGLNAWNPTTVTFDGVTARAVDVNGVTTDVAEATVTAIHGSAGSQGAPNQTALVVTLLTARAGRSGKGRMYLPYLTPTFVAGTDRLVQANVTGLLNNINTMITAVGSSGTTGAGPWAVSVQSRVVPGAAPPVNRVAIGDVVDTQRRRRDKIKENYTVQPVTPPVVP